MPHRQQPKKTTLADSARFLSQWFRNPGVVGAVAPSGPALAKTMASYVDLARGGPSVELGPGTGPVTKALLARGIPADRLLLVEYETRFCRMLAERYPGVKIVQGDAYGLKATLAGHVNGEVATVISSLLERHRAKWKRRIQPPNPNIRHDVAFEEHPNFTLIDIYAADTLGFLHKITTAISEVGLNISFAKIATRVDGIVDSFYVLDGSGKKITDPEKLELIRQVLLKSINDFLESE